MSLLTGTGLAVSFGAQDVFAGVDVAVPASARIALVGRNGCGKTSLLRVLAGLDRPAAGIVSRARSVTIGYLAQHPDFPDDRRLEDEMRVVFADLEAQAVELQRLAALMGDAGTAEDASRRYAALEESFELAGGYTYRTRIDQVLSGLGFASSDHSKRLGEMSGGQRTRALLARLLLQAPDLLLMDEPTNHLDVDSLEWLEGALKSMTSGVVVVAHDRAFLDAVVDRVWELTPKGIESYPGNYSAYQGQRAERRRSQELAMARQAREIGRTEEYIRRNIAGQNTRQAKGRRTRLERVERLRLEREAAAPALRLARATRTGDIVFALRNLEAGYEHGRTVVAVDDLAVRRGDRITLLGANGSGKTTLLGTLSGELAPLAGDCRIGAAVRLGVFAQTQAHLDGRATILDTVVAESGMQPEAGRGFLGRYGFSGDDAFKTVEVLSGGERARVALAMLELAGANVLLLDEPTNHLDLVSQEALESVLADFDGTMILVTHDRHLMRSLGYQVWAIEDGRVEVFRDGYDAYRAARAERSEASADESASAERHAEERLARRRGERQQRRREEERAALERRHRELEADLESLERELHQAVDIQDVAAIARLGDDYARRQEEAEEVLARWLSIEDADGLAD